MIQQTEEQKKSLTNYTSFVIYQNRYGDKFSFQKLDQNTYIFVHDYLAHARFGSSYTMSGSKEDGKFDYNDLGMVDPPGGPALFTGWFKIDGKIVTRIRTTCDDGIVGEIYFETEV